MGKLADLVADDSGQDLMEYALMAALLGCASIAGIRGLASEINNTLIAVGNALLNK